MSRLFKKFAMMVLGIFVDYKIYHLLCYHHLRISNDADRT